MDLWANDTRPYEILGNIKCAHYFREQEVLHYSIKSQQIMFRRYVYTKDSKVVVELMSKLRSDNSSRNNYPRSNSIHRLSSTEHISFRVCGML